MMDETTLKGYCLDEAQICFGRGTSCLPASVSYLVCMVCMEGVITEMTPLFLTLPGSSWYDPWHHPLAVAIIKSYLGLCAIRRALSCFFC